MSPLELRLSTPRTSEAERQAAEKVMAACANKPVRRIKTSADVLAAAQVSGWPELHRDGIALPAPPPGVTADPSFKRYHATNVRLKPGMKYQRKPGVLSRPEMHAKIMSENNQKVLAVVTANPGLSPAAIGRLSGVHYSTVRDVIQRSPGTYRVEVINPPLALSKEGTRTNGRTQAVYVIQEGSA